MRNKALKSITNHLKSILFPFYRLQQKKFIIIDFFGEMIQVVRSGGSGSGVERDTGANVGVRWGGGWLQEGRRRVVYQVG